MLNKKLLLAAAIIASTLSFSASAKTEGNYVGLNLIDTYTRSKVLVVGGSASKYPHNDISFGVDYKYAFNFNRFFVAPGIFYDNNSANADFALPEAVRFSNNVQNSYGVKADFGYDVTEKFSPFVTLGFSMTRSTISYYSGAYPLTKSATNNEGLVYGLGFRYKLSKAVSVVASYELTQFGLNSNLDATIGGSDKLNSDYKVAKLGVAYNF